MDIEAIYSAIVAGTGDGVDLAWSRRSLQTLALDRAKHGTNELRLGALRVSALLGPTDGLPIANELVRDPDPQIRTLAFNQVVAARDAGLAALRTVAGGQDTSLAIAAFDLLVRWVDLPAAATARRCLQSSEPGIRLRAATLLGHVSGPSVGPELRRLAEGDPEAEVRAAAAEALRRIAGELPRGTREPWWSDAVAPVGSPAHDVPIEVAPSEAAPSEGAPSAAAPIEGATAASTALVPRPPDPEPATPASEPDPRVPADVEGLLRRLGSVGAADRAPLLDALGRAPASVRAAGLGRWTPGADPAFGRGLAVAAAAAGDPGAVSRLLPLLSDPDPSVRIAGTEAISGLGTAGTLPRLSVLFSDPEPTVGAAAVRAVAALAVRVGRADVGRSQLLRIGGTVSDAVAVALAEARELLGAG